ncbi:MAG: hypothetical protein WAN74_08320 [Thermoplasmata archaeon]
MGAPSVPKFVEFSPTIKVDLIVSDWRAELLPEWSSEQKERRLYDQAWGAYSTGDYGFGLWCWHECDRLSNALSNNVREVTRVLGPGRYFGFSQKKAVAEAVPFDRIYRPRKGDMSRPRPDSYVLAHYQLLCVYAVRAQSGDPKAKAQLEIALGDVENQRRADPFLRHFEAFQSILARGEAETSSVASAPEATRAPPKEGSAARTSPSRRRSGT